MPDRIEFDLTSPTGAHLAESPGQGRCRRALPLRRAGRRPRSRRRRDHRRRQGAAGFAGYQFGLDDEEVEPSSSRSKICRRPTPRARRASPSISTSCRRARIRWKRKIAVRMAEPGGRAVEHKIALPVTRERQHDRRQAAVLRPLARRRRQRDLRCRRRRARRRRARAARSALRAAAHRHALSVLQARRQLELRAGEDDQARRRRQRSTRRSTSRRVFRCR